MRLLDGVAGVLLDVDGTLLSADRAIEGASAALARLRAVGLPFRFTTNTTRRPRRAVAEALARAGIGCAPSEILVPSTLALRRIAGSGRTRARLLVPGGAREDFAGIDPVGDPPDWVVVGDLGEAWDLATLNAALRHLLAGARLIALHRNRFWLPDGRTPTLDAGAFVAALEYAAGIEAEVVGKPSPAFFELAADEMGVAPKDVLVVGDDPETDGAGAAAAGCRVALVRTGKFREELLARTGIRPAALLGSVADLI